MGQTGKTSKIATVESRTITVRIGRPFDEVYDFLANPENWNQWAHGLGRTIVGLPTRMAEQPRFDSRRGIASAFSIIT